MCTDTQPLMTCHISRHADATVMRVAGEIDLSTQADLTDAIQQAMGSGATRVVLDLCEVHFMGSAGLNALLDAHRRAEHEQRDFRVIAGSRGARRTIDVAGVRQFLVVYPTLTEALAPV